MVVSGQNVKLVAKSTQFSFFSAYDKHHDGDDDYVKWLLSDQTDTDLNPDLGVLLWEEKFPAAFLKWSFTAKLYRKAINGSVWNVE